MIGVVSWEHTIQGKKADMGRHPLIKVIKRDERERAVQEVLESTNPDLSAHENSGDPATRVAEWINEFRQERLAQHQTIKQQLGWWQGESDN
jgi:hypothetical protein